MPIQPTAERLRRIMVMVPWVMARGDPPVEEVCERFGLSSDELAADIELLMVCGLWPFTPGDMIDASIEGGRVMIRMPVSRLDRPPRLTSTEAIALLVTGRAVADLPGIEETPSLRSALGKLAAALTPEGAADAEHLADRIAVTFGTAGSEMLASLRAAASERARLSVSYWSAGRAEMTHREIDPLLVFGAQGAWYLVAVDTAAEEIKRFRVDRIRDAARTGETFEVPADFDPAAYQQEPLYAPSPQDMSCVVDVAPAAAWLREVLALDAEEELGDGRLRLRLRTQHLPWLVRFLMIAGIDATPVEPPALADAVRARAAAALARYGD